MGKKRTPDLGAEHDPTDAEAFHTAMRDVKPLLRESRHAPVASRGRPRPRKAPDSVQNLDQMMPLISAATEAEGASAVLSFQRGGIRDQVMRRLRRGLYPSEDELDLHGLNQTAARDRLAEFLTHSRDCGCRCVRIVHGKGYRSGARGPVLKAAVNLWLRRHLDVVAFTSARAIDGGTGAVYVLLRA
ncbi:MAG TPA: Smr/MutS family protein [Steroidobacteraceae bacterium]|jgi:DNA-nicking Smr family endonuclease